VFYNVHSSLNQNGSFPQAMAERE